MVVDFGRGSGFVAVDLVCFVLDCGSMVVWLDFVWVSW